MGIFTAGGQVRIKTHMHDHDDWTCRTGSEHTYAATGYRRDGLMHQLQLI